MMSEMKRRLTIEITDKIATCLDNIPLVCGNADYEIEFIFDSEWDKHDVKTAMFRVAGKSYPPQVFSGNICKVPVLRNTRVVAIGVFAGTVDDGTLSTSMPALVECLPCITDGEDEICAPEDDVYTQIVKLCEEAKETAEDVERRANEGDFDGKPGKPGVGIERVYSQPTADGTGTYAKFDKTDGTTDTFILPNGKDGQPGKSGLPDRDTYHNLSSNPEIFNNTHNEFTYDSDFTSGSLALFIKLFTDSDGGLSDTTKSSAATITVNVVDGLTIGFYLYDRNGEGDWSGDKMSLVWSGAEPTFTPGYTYFLSFVPLSDTRILGAWSEVPTV